LTQYCAEAARLAAENERLKKLDREAATYVESVICLKSNRFTGNPPYVGWKGLGLALNEDYDELACFRAENERLRAALEWIVGCALTEPQAMTDKARAALKEPR
jgi:hypothetical protein